MLLIWDSIDMTFSIIEILEDEEAISNSTLNDQDILLFIIMIRDGKDGSKYIPLPQIILGNMFYYRPCLGSKTIFPGAYYVQRIMIKIS